MASVLVGDDERTYREYLGRFLARAGHEVRSAAGSREAIELGSRFRPDVLVVDWMLRNHVHGLHVAEVLRAVRPDLEAILVTGFPSRDLRAAAQRAGVFAFLEKPFDVEELCATVGRAAQRAGGGSRPAPLPVAEVDAAGSICFANPAARDLFAETAAGREANAFDEVFGPGKAPDPEAAAAAWLPVVPRGARRPRWEVRAGHLPPQGTRLWILRQRGAPVKAALVEMLLGVEERPPPRWPFAGRVLVVDDDELFRHVAVALLESAGAACYAVESGAEALRLLEHDSGMRVLLLDYELPGGPAPDELVARVHARRPDVAIVGNSARDRAAQFAAAGVERFLIKPWRPSELIDLLQDGAELPRG